MVSYLCSLLDTVDFSLFFARSLIFFVIPLYVEIILIPSKSEFRRFK